MLPDMDPRTCVYLSLALFLEDDIQYCDGALSQWLFCSGSTTSTTPIDQQDKEANNGKARYFRRLKTAMDSPAFVPVDDGKLGSHSIRKSAATRCRENGSSKDDLDYRARWASKRMQDAYVNYQLTWPDVNCATRLTFKGVCKYKIKEDAGLTDEWLCQHVTPHITSVFGNKVVAILAKPLLWACFSKTFSERVQPEICNRICGQFIQLEREGYLEDGVNPVERVEVIPNEGQFLERQPSTATHFIRRATNHLLVRYSWWKGKSRRDESTARGRECWSS